MQGVLEMAVGAYLPLQAQAHHLGLAITTREDAHAEGHIYHSPLEQGSLPPQQTMPPPLRRELQGQNSAYRAASYVAQ